MQIILTVIVPIFAVIAVGFLASRLKLLEDSVGEGLAKFVFVIAVPALLFRTLATANFAGANPLLLWFAYFLGVALTWTPATIAVRRLTGTDRRTSIIAGISASFANTVFVAIPAVQRAYGDAGLEALFLIIAIHMPVMMTVATLLMERAARLDALASGTVATNISVAATLKRIALNLSRNAIIVGILSGLLWRLTGLALPGAIEDVIRLLGSTAGPVSLFAMGMSLTRYGLRGGIGSALIVSGLSLLFMPAIVYAIGYELLPPLWLKVAVLTAACPAGVNCYLFASYFKSGEKLAATSILVTTLLSVVTLAAWLAILA